MVNFESVEAIENNGLRGTREREKGARKMKKAPLRRLGVILYGVIVARASDLPKRFVGG